MTKASSHGGPWWRRQSLLNHTVLFMMDEGVYDLLRVSQRLNTFYRKGCPGKEVHWLHTYGLARHLINMKNSRFSCYITSSHGPLRGMSWSRVPGQIVWPGADPNTYQFSVMRCTGDLNLLRSCQFFCLAAWIRWPHRPGSMVEFLLGLSEASSSKRSTIKQRVK